MAFMPGALTDKVLTTYRTPMDRYDGVVLHVAVSEAKYPSYQPGTAAHFYVRRDGTICQQIDTRYRAGTAYEGNKRLIGVETQGGVKNANREPWTPEQIDALARLCAWASKTHGIPLQAMPNSRPTSKGIAYHRQGIDGNFGTYDYPGRVTGGEHWSRSAGKICPGDGKIAAIPEIIRRAKIENAGNVTPKPPTPPKPQPTPSKEATVKATLKVLDLTHADKKEVTGTDVKRLQGLLLAQGYGPSGLVDSKGRLDGRAGSSTKKYLGQFQVKTNTGDGKGHADYVCGEGTWTALLEK